MPSNSFFDRVYAVARQIPYGKVTSYGAIAKFLGAAKSARMVGYAMNGSSLAGDIPAHRVVNRIGVLTGKQHFGGSQMMEQLLTSEGLIVNDNQIQNFTDHFWDPSDHLNREEYLP